jgi:E3 ubiquitin-protein ligase BRE1
MTVEAATALSAPPLGLVKMEERKRASASDHHDDSAPPAKRQATNVNGPIAEPAVDTVNFGTHGSSWTVELEVRDRPLTRAPSPEIPIITNIDDLQKYQKDALLRKMKEYKRENTQLESRLADLQKIQKLVHEHLFTNDIFMAKVCCSCLFVGTSWLTLICRRTISRQSKWATSNWWAHKQVH